MDIVPWSCPVLHQLQRYSTVFVNDLNCSFFFFFQLTLVNDLESNITGDVLIYLCQQDLREVGVLSVGHQLRILKSIYNLAEVQGIEAGPNRYIPPTVISLQEAELGYTNQKSSTTCPSKLPTRSLNNTNTLEALPQLLKLFQVRDERMSVIETELRRLADTSARLREELLPVFRFFKESKPLPLPVHESLSSPAKSHNHALSSSSSSSAASVHSTNKPATSKEGVHRGGLANQAYLSTHGHSTKFNKSNVINNATILTSHDSQKTNPNTTDSSDLSFNTNNLTSLPANNVVAAESIIAEQSGSDTNLSSRPLTHSLAQSGEEHNTQSKNFETGKECNVRTTQSFGPTKKTGNGLGNQQIVPSNRSASMLHMTHSAIQTGGADRPELHESVQSSDQSSSTEESAGDDSFSAEDNNTGTSSDGNVIDGLGANSDTNSFTHDSPIPPDVLCHKTLPRIANKQKTRAAGCELLVCYDDEERTVGLHEFPHRLFKELKAQGKDPVFKVRKTVDVKPNAGIIVNGTPGGLL